MFSYQTNEEKDVRNLKINFASPIQNDLKISTALNPTILFDELPDKKPGYGYLRTVQSQVLEDWYTRRNEPDILIKVNTGGGKTIDGLLILQSCLNEGVSPALYVAPDNFLKDQVIEEARKLGLPTTTNPEDSVYLRGDAICVINADKLFNGRSIFSSSRKNGYGVKIGAVVIDDVHAALPIIKAQTRVSIPYENEAYRSLLQLFETYLQKYSPAEWLDLEDRSPSSLVEIPFWVWREKQTDILPLLREATKTASSPGFYQFPAIRTILPLCRCIFTNSEVSIAPPLPPLNHISSFVEAKRRIYLSATLANDGVLVANLGAESSSLQTPVTPKTAGDIGERMILLPQEYNPEIPIDTIRDQIATFSSQHRTVVLCGNRLTAKQWESRGAMYGDTTNLVSIVNGCKDEEINLAVFANKYDGIDLPQDSCRVIVIDGLPAALSPEERVDGRLLSADNSIGERQIQRIEQGMGRAVRSNEDYCVVILLGAQLTRILSDPDTFSQLSQATQAQMDLSHKILSPALRGKEMEDVLSVAQQSLERDRDWVIQAKRTLKDIAQDPQPMRSEQISIRRAFQLSLQGGYTKAGDLLNEESVHSSGAKKGWLLYQAARYYDLDNPTIAQQILNEARTYNPRVVPSIVQQPYEKIVTGSEQASAAQSYLNRTITNGNELLLRIAELKEDLAFDPESTDDFEQGIDSVGKYLGFNAQRPELISDQGPDNLWIMPDGNYWIIEAKSGATSEHGISKKDAGQLSQSVEWFKRIYPGSKYTPIMIHPKDRMGPSAEIVEDMWLFTPHSIKQLLHMLDTYAVFIARNGWANEENVAAALQNSGLQGNAIEKVLVRPKK